MKKTFIVLSAIVFFAACSEKPTTLTEVSVKGKYSIVLPDYLEKTNELGTEPSLQYVNHKDEVYVVAYDESTKALAESGLDNIKKYYESVLGHITEGMENYKVGTPLDTVINGKQAMIAKITGQFKVHDEIHDCFYEMEVIQDSLKSVKVITWTMDHHEDKFGGDMDNTIKSIKFL
ncbi:MAG: hypothetical protein V4667_09515 [Bacteroidota bacterium]